MDYEALAELLFPNVTKTPEDLEKEYPPRELPEGAVVSRMGPSPTGFVHLGNLVQGMTSERMSHQSGGVHFLRVEDTDAKREVEGAIPILIEGLSHYGITFDEGETADGDKGDYGPYRQSKRAAIYHVYAKKLVREGKAYPCFCTEEELAAAHAEQEKNKENFGYYGKYAVWRDRPMEDIKAALDAGKPWVLRFHSEGSIEHKIKFTDLIKGNLELTENDMDIVLLKSDGIPTYHFAHACDDHLMRTTHVVRGDEWLPSLPVHLQLFAALGFKPPKYAHIGTLQKMDGSSKRKLSKRKDPELALSYYREQGYPVQSVYEYIMTILNSNFEDWRRANPTANIDEFKFSPKKMNPAGSLFDVDKLRDVSKDVISRMTADEVYDGVLDWSAEFDPEFHDLLAWNPDYAKALLAIGRGGKKPRKDFAVWSELRPYMSFMYSDIFEPDYTPPEGMTATDMAVILRAYYRQRMLMWHEERTMLEEDGTAWFESVKRLAEALGYCPDTKLYRSEPEKWKGSVGDVSMALRIAICGRKQSPDLYEVMKIWGTEDETGVVAGRLESCAAALGADTSDWND